GDGLAMGDAHFDRAGALVRDLLGDADHFRFRAAFRHAAGARDRAGDLLGFAAVGRAANGARDLLANFLAASHAALFALNARDPALLLDHLRVAAIVIAIVFAAILVLLLAQAAEEAGP